MRYKLALLIIIFCIITPAGLMGQNFLIENFEDGIPIEWNVYIDQNYNWETSEGGPDGHPSSAAQGIDNALFYTETSERTSTILIPDTLDLSEAIRPQLSFSYAQEALNGTNDSLWVKYKTGENDPWRSLGTYFAPTEADEWARDSLFLPDEALVDTFILGFQATGNYGYGVSLDSVVISENGYYYETFDDIEIPSKWNVYVESDKNWDTLDGGHSTNPDIPNSGNPESAYQGNANAIFYASEAGTPTTILQLPSIDLEYAIKPDLVFAHAMEEWSGDYDNLRVHFKAGEDSSWVFLEEYMNPTENDEWKIRTIELPERALQDTFILGFEGIANGGHGVCIDSVLVIERGIVPKKIDSISVNQASEESVVSESSVNPILRIDVSVSGNTGTLYLDSLTVSSLNTDDANIREDGVKLFLTQEEFFDISQQLGSAVSFENGEAHFRDIKHDFSKGTKYLWVTYDIAADSTHEIHNNVADAMIKAGNIHIGNSSYPETDQSPEGERIIKESLFYDDFETDNGWTLEGEFERDQPQGKGGWTGYPDPEEAYQGGYVLGTDLTGLGSYLGDYEPNLSDRQYTAVSKTINADYYRDLNLTFYRWLNVEINDSATVDISWDNGENWHNLWRNTDFVRDNAWRQVDFQLPDSVEYKSEVKLRFNIGPTTSDKNYSGWNIDNLSIYGNYIAHDVSVSEWISPGDGCGHTAHDTVTVRVENKAGEPTNDTIPVSCSVDGGETIVRDTIFGSIPVGEDTVFTFSSTVDLSEPKLYKNVFATTDYPEDEWTKNDTLFTEIYAPPTYELPYVYDFEDHENDFWEVSAESNNNSWEWGVPSGSTIQPEEEDDNSWVTDLDSRYNDDERSYVVGPCFDMREQDFPVIELRIFSDSEENYDGANIQYSLHEEDNWHTIDTLTYVDRGDFNWTWYSNLDTIEALDAPGWDHRSFGWFTVRTFLPVEITNKDNVRFRVQFASNESQKYEGFAFDDIKIFNAPDDVGADSIHVPQTQCEPQSVFPVIGIKNFGLDSINIGDTIPVGLDVQFESNSPVTVIDTCIVDEVIPPDSVYQFTFNKSIGVDSVGTYSATAYTMLDDEDPEFYNLEESNDTTTKAFEIYGYPTVDLGPDINTVEPDTLTLSTAFDSIYDYSWEGGSGTASGNEYYDLDISDKDTIIVTVTDTLSGCISGDSVVVTRLKPDIGVDSILSPESDCEIGEETYINARVRNYGTDTLFEGDSVILGAFYETTAVRDTALMSERVNPGETFTYEFTKPLDMSTLDYAYNLQVYTQLVPENYETDNSNDTLSKEVVSYGYPDFSLDIDTTVAALSYEINAEPGYDLYEWEYGDENSPDFLVTDSLYETTGDEWYTVTVTDEYGCSTTDSAHVKLMIHDLMVSQRNSPVSDCELSDSSVVEIEIYNNGTDTVHSGESIFVGFGLNNQEIQIDTIEVSEDLYPGSTVVHEFDSLVDLSSFGDYTFDFYTRQPEEMRPENDTLTDIVTAYGYPDADLGPDTIVTAISYTLDPGDFESYEWHDGSNSPTFTVTEDNQTDDHLYSVTVTDQYGCPDSDTAEVMLNIIDMSVTSINSPTSVCNYGDSLVVEIELTNSGNTSIVSGVTFPLRYNIKGVNNAEEEYELEEPLEAGESVDYSFTTKTVVNTAGQKDISASVNYEDDVYPDNDKLEETFQVFALPEINFESDTIWTEDFPITLDPGSFSSYEWQDGSTNSTYDADEEGTYWVMVTNQVGCSASDTVVVVEGVEDDDDEDPESAQSVEETDKIKIFPNPARDKIFVELDVNERLLKSMKLVDASGAVVYSGEDYRTDDVITIETGHYARGVYYLVLQLGDTVYQKQIVLH